jgi:hypothetical protein
MMLFRTPDQIIFCFEILTDIFHHFDVVGSIIRSNAEQFLDYFISLQDFDHFFTQKSPRMMTRYMLEVK